MPRITKVESRTPREKLEVYKRQMGWASSLASTSKLDFNDEHDDVFGSGRQVVGKGRER